MKKISILLFCVIFMVTVCNGFMVYAESDVSASAEVDGRRVTITGNVANAGTERKVTLLVGEENNIVFIDEKNCDASGNFSFYFTVQEDLPGGTYRYRIGGKRGAVPYEGFFNYERVTDEGILEQTYTVNGNSGDVVNVIVKAEHIASFKERNFELIYNPEQLDVVDFFGLSPVESLTLGQESNLEIISHSPGSIVFRINNILIPEGKVWSGVLNLFKFKFADGYTGSSTLSIKEK